MTDNRLAEIQSLRRAMTQGELHFECGSLLCDWEEGTPHGPSDTNAGGSLKLEWIPNGRDEVTNRNADADGAFFAAAGPIVDELLAEVRRLREENARLKENRL